MALTGWSSQMNANGVVYMKLFDIYRRLGRNQDAVRVPERAAAHVIDSGLMISSFEEQLDRPDEAVAIYRRLAAEARNPVDNAEALQSVAELYHQQKRFSLRPVFSRYFSRLRSGAVG